MFIHMAKQTQCRVHVLFQIAGANDLAGFMLQPVYAPYRININVRYWLRIYKYLTLAYKRIG